MTTPVSGLKPPIARAMGASPNSARGGAKLRARSSSAGRGPDKGLRARYWAYLFENLQRAVDEIYHTCETDESTLECKEAILILENYTREFTALINWIQLSKQLENTPPPDRPTYLAWEVRKSSLGRGAQARNFLGSRPATAVQRASPSLVSVAIQCGSDDSGQACPDTVEKHPVPSTDVSGSVVCVPVPRTVAVLSCDVVLETTESTESEKSASDDLNTTTQAKATTPPESTKGSVKEPVKTSSCVASSLEGTKPAKTSPLTASTVQAPLGARLSTPRSTKLSRPEAKSKTNTEPHRPMTYSSSLKGGPGAQHGTIAGARTAGVTASVARPNTAAHSPKASVPSRGPSVASNMPLPASTSQRTAVPARTTAEAQSKPSEDCKGGSALSLSRSSSGRSWADKVKGPSTAEDGGTLTKSASLDPMAVDLDDSEGWETVRRNKPRSRNSPPKKMLAHQASQGSAGGVKRSPSAPVISAPAPCRVKTPRRSSAPLSSGPAPSSRLGRSRVEQQQGPKSATSMPSLVPERRPRDSATAREATHSRPSLGGRSKSSLCPPTRPARLAEEPPRSSRGAPAQGDQGTRIVKEDPANAAEGDPAVGKEKPASLLQEENGPSQERNPLQEEKPMSPFEEDAADGQDPSPLEAEEMVHEMGLSWGEEMDCLEELELRIPGRALQMHEKLSCATRKRPLSETIQRHKERQAKAQEQRERIREEKAQRCRDQSKKVEEKKAQQEELQLQRRLVLEKRLQRAAEKREMQLKNKVKRAHDEEEKVNEIAFINTLEAQNKRIDLLSREKDHEARLQDIQEERQRKLEEKAAKEAAAEERRKVLEAERQAKLLEIQEKRKLKDEKVQQQQLEKEKLRQSLLKQKEREREQRLTALNAAQLATAEELQKKIQLKQEESARRHEENIEQIRLKAFELSVRKCSSNNDDAPHHQPYETKKICSLCNVLIGSEVYLLSHLRGKKTSGGHP